MLLLKNYCHYTPLKSTIKSLICPFCNLGKSNRNEGQVEPSSPKRPRGQQPGSIGHGRTARPDLPQREETMALVQLNR